LGDLTYQYDSASQTTRVGGSYARTGLPQPLTGATYNIANQQTGFGSQSLTYDLNGNLINDGVNTYTWNVRDELVGISGPGLTASFQHDALGRRIGKTINGATAGFHYSGDNIVQEQAGGRAAAVSHIDFKTTAGIDASDGLKNRVYLLHVVGED
jgi:hypothetical protein